MAWTYSAYLADGFALLVYVQLVGGIIVVCSGTVYFLLFVAMGSARSNHLELAVSDVSLCLIDCDPHRIKTRLSVYHRT